MQDLGSVSVWNLESGSLISLWIVDEVISSRTKCVEGYVHEVKSGERVSL